MREIDKDVPHLSQSGSIVEAWRDYKLRRNLALFFLFGWAPVTLGLFLMTRFWLHQPLVSLVIVVAWWITACLTIWWAGEFRCPRCRRRYGALGARKRFSEIWRGLFDESCANCKLRKFESFGPEGPNVSSLDRRAARS